MLSLALVPQHGGAWEHYGNDPGGTKYSEITEITADNISRLQQAWVYRTGEMGKGYASGHRRSFQATPLFYEGRLFLTSAFGKAYAVDAGTGEEIWRFDSKLDKTVSYVEHASRGLSLWHASEPLDQCEHRLFFGTIAGQFFALDAATGERCRDFGDDGRIDLTIGVGPVDSGRYSVTSPPITFGNLVITGSAIGDNRRVTSERGIVRAFDAITGALVWSWDPIPRKETDPAFGSWSGDSARLSGGANAWAPLSVDEAAGLVFVPTSAPSPDFYGGHRGGDNRYANSLVALDAQTGAVVWHQQLVHHDVWDYDLPAQPVLADLDLGYGIKKAVLQTTKMGMLFVFDRLSGEPLIGVEERAVSQDGVEGERLSKTQPFSVLPPFVSHKPLTPKDAFGLVLFDKWACQESIRKYRSDGIYTPPTEEGTIMTPGFVGGSNWGGISVDAKRGIVIANVAEIPTIIRLIPREKFVPDAWQDWGTAPMEGTPYVLARDAFLSPLGLPCTRPPWGKLLALNLKTQSILWEKPLGSTADLAPSFVPDFNWGVPGIGGSLITASDIVFIGAAAEHKFRAFALMTGDLLWEAKLPRAGMASPMTYKWQNEQFVVIAAGGHGSGAAELGDFLVAFKLKK